MLDGSLLRGGERAVRTGRLTWRTCSNSTAAFLERMGLDRQVRAAISTCSCLSTTMAPATICQYLLAMTLLVLHAEHCK